MARADSGPGPCFRRVHVLVRPAQEVPCEFSLRAGATRALLGALPRAELRRQCTPHGKPHRHRQAVDGRRLEQTVLHFCGDQFEIRERVGAIDQNSKFVAALAGNRIDSASSLR